MDPSNISITTTCVSAEERIVPCNFILIIFQVGADASKLVNQCNILEMGRWLIIEFSRNLILVSSSNSLEVAVLSLGQDNQTWVLWNLEPEEMRITLPYLKTGEAFPVGVAIDYSVPLQVSIGEQHCESYKVENYILNFSICFRWQIGLGSCNISNDMRRPIVYLYD